MCVCCCYCLGGGGGGTGGGGTGRGGGGGGLVPSILPPFRERIRLGHAAFVDNSV